MPDSGEPTGGLRGLLRRLTGAPAKPGPAEDDSRRARRLALPIPVTIRRGAEELTGVRLHDVSLLGVRVDSATSPRVGERLEIAFEGRVDVCEPFLLEGNVVRLVDQAPPGFAVEIDRTATSSEALAQYRGLVLYYVRHRPLLEDTAQGFVEGRCTSCGWIGKVGERNPRCPKCRGEVEPLSSS